MAYTKPIFKSVTRAGISVLCSRFEKMPQSFRHTLP